MALRASLTALEGAPRIGPVPSATSHIEWALRASESLGLDLYPWQQFALNESLACKEDGSLKYREVAIVASRQNGKTQILRPRIIAAMDAAEDKSAKSIEIGGKLIADMKQHCQGVHIMAIGWEAEVPAILAAAGVRA